jgi:hypothetical protein
VPAFVYQVLAHTTDDAVFLVHSWWFAMAMYAVTIAYLLRYVFSRDVMTADKLWGAAAAYLLLGAVWTFAYALIGHYHADAFAIYGTPTPVDTIDLLYFSFTTLTSTGYGDITPFIRQARALCVVEQITGTLYLTILIARLAGVYPPPRAAHLTGQTRSSGSVAGVLAIACARMIAAARWLTTLGSPSSSAKPERRTSDGRLMGEAAQDQRAAALGQGARERLQRLEAGRVEVDHLVHLEDHGLDGVAATSNNSSSLPTEPKNSEPNSLYADTPCGASSSGIGSTRVRSETR